VLRFLQSLALLGVHPADLLSEDRPRGDRFATNCDPDHVDLRPLSNLRKRGHDSRCSPPGHHRVGCTRRAGMAAFGPLRYDPIDPGGVFPM